jgi:hypothetical protein
MKFLSTRVHGVIDYVVSLLVMASPWLLGFADGGAATWVPVIVGAMGLAYSACTNYELGVVRSLSMRTHLALDMMSGALLALSPWLFGFSEYVYLPHLIMGIFEIGAALVTDPVPAVANNRTDRRGMHSSRTHTAH